MLAAENAARKKRKLEPVCKVSPDWKYLLTSKQQQYLADGLKQLKSIECSVINLGDNPEKRHVPAAGSPLPTFKHNAGILWVPEHNRWLLPLERAAVMGYPVFAQLASSASVDLDSVTRDASQIGNGFHIACASLVIASVLRSVGHPLPAQPWG